ncbi:MAG: hypothetical protein A2539_01420 [Elusimicrobia bacterium RIFOXYD2_FULL_34_15]|nr:MAG: hypothetical protein A2539_01420 [Elusimicrobia bacterium RIFOXYD2_FULL_34_15]
MVKNGKLLEKFENNYIKKNKISYKKALKIFESLWKEAVLLKVLPSKNSAENFKSKIRIAKAINSGI